MSNEYDNPVLQAELDKLIEDTKAGKAASLTQRQAHALCLDKLYRWICVYKCEHDGVAPSVRDILRGMNYRSTSVVNRDLTILASKGVIYFTGLPRDTRSIGVTGGRYMPPEGVR